MRIAFKICLLAAALLFTKNNFAQNDYRALPMWDIKLSFKLTPEQLSLVDETGNIYQPTGKLMISVGGGQPGVKNRTTSNVVIKIISIQ